MEPGLSELWSKEKDISHFQERISPPTAHLPTAVDVVGVGFATLCGFRPDVTSEWVKTCVRIL